MKRLTAGFGAIVAALALVIGLAAPASGIINGEKATQLSTVSLQSVSDQGVADHECGGTPINSWWIITAAHCEPYVHDQVRVGSLNWTTGGTVLPVAKVIANPAHDSVHGGFGNDIALVKLAKKIDKGVAPIFPIGIPGPVGKQGFTAGWGLTCDRDFNDPTCTSANPVDLQQLTMKYVDDSTCDLIRPSDGVQLNNHHSMNCVVVASGKKGGVCFGDSGSGYFEKVAGITAVTGIVSGIMNTTVLQPFACSQTPTGDFNRDAVTDVSSQLPWMIKVLLEEDPAAAQDVKSHVVTLQRS